MLPLLRFLFIALFTSCLCPFTLCIACPINQREREKKIDKRHNFAHSSRWDFTEWPSQQKKKYYHTRKCCHLSLCFSHASPLRGVCRIGRKKIIGHNYGIKRFMGEQQREKFVWVVGWLTTNSSCVCCVLRRTRDFPISYGWIWDGSEHECRIEIYGSSFAAAVCRVYKAEKRVEKGFFFMLDFIVQKREREGAHHSNLIKKFVCSLLFGRRLEMVYQKNLLLSCSILSIVHLCIASQTLSELPRPISSVLFTKFHFIKLSPFSNSQSSCSPSLGLSLSAEYDNFRHESKIWDERKFVVSLLRYEREAGEMKMWKIWQLVEKLCYIEKFWHWVEDSREVERDFERNYSRKSIECWKSW